MKIKLGIDPTAPRLHLGHLIPLLKAKSLQKDNELTIVLGTFTAQLGDPAGQDKTRPILSKEEVENNANAILAQIDNILLPNFKIFRNGDFFSAATLPLLFSKISKFTVSQIMARDAFQKRQTNSQPIGLHELLVPILQAWDSVILETEVEIGGEDQLFTFQLTRHLQEMEGQKPQTCIFCPIINGLDGRKMSKSFNNCIFLDEHPNDIFGKVMSISDSLMEEWLKVFIIENPPEHPMLKKKALASFITTQICGENDALTHFETVIQNNFLPENIPEIKAIDIVQAITIIRNVSKSEARRLIQNNAVSVNNQKITTNISLNIGDIVKIGNRTYGKII